MGGGANRMRTILIAQDDDSVLNNALNRIAAQALRWLGPSDVLIGYCDPTLQAFAVQTAQGAQSGAAGVDWLPLGFDPLRDALDVGKPILFPESGQPAPGAAPAGVEPRPPS